MSILITNATVVTVDETHRVIENGAVYVEKDRIAAVGDAHVLGEQYSNAATVVDGNGKVVMPGFVSAHNHVGYAVFRGRAEDIGHAPTHRLYLPMSGVIAQEERQVIGALAVTELLRGGVTTILEMEEDAELFAPFIESSGIRALIGVMVNDVNLEALARGETVFDAAVRDQQLDQANGLAERWHGRANGRIQAVMAATGLSTSSPGLLQGLRQGADEKGLRLSAHLGFGERDLVQRIHGMAQFDFAGAHGMLGPDMVAVHCYEVDDDEVSILAQSGTHLAHCPHMNQFRGEVAPIQAMRAKGMQVGLGIDNYFSDYFEVLRSCLASARIRAHDPEILSAPEVLALGTIDAARVLGLDQEIGSIEPGKKADLQLVNMQRLGLTPVNDPVTTLVYHGHAKDVDMVLVDGEVVVSDGMVRTADQDDLVVRAGDAADAAWKRFAECYGGYSVAPPN
ncbi:MAG: amidohydrolase family protein [Pseudomonadota bacterium]|nr:amidohydrolase family protein [Pseudomonadota bacterium]